MGYVVKENAIYGTYESLKTITHKKHSLMNMGVDLLNDKIKEIDQ